MTTSPFQLYEQQTIHGSFGDEIKEIFIDSIDVCVSEVHRTHIQNEIQYYIKVVTGLTLYKVLEEKKKYILTDGKIRYEIQSFIIGRWTQLQLKEVIL